MRQGAVVGPDGWTSFTVWAPAAASLELIIEHEDADHATHPLTLDPALGVWTGRVEGAPHGTRYRYRFDDGTVAADPASGWQPDGVHGPSAVVDPARFAWTDDGWPGVGLADAVIYELHVGTFTPDGTFDGVIEQLDRLVELGVTIVELMPVAATPGRRNWGYDGVFPCSVHEAYGGPDGLARLVDAAHAKGLAVMLDVVYNHLGPEGNVLPRFGPYLTDDARTPWGEAINVAMAGSDAVRDYFIDSARRWIDDFHVDGFRVDAIDRIVDPTALPFLEQFVGAVRSTARAAGRTVLVIAESASNDPAVVRAPAVGGLGFDAVWNDDIHHALRVAMTGDRSSYYVDYDGVADLAHALAHRWVFDGRYSPYRGRHHGRSADDLPFARFVVFSANHDHVGNTPLGDRPPYDRGRTLVAAATVLLSPYTPLLFMGDEYGDPAPFPYFVDHGDEEVLAATRRGRREEFAAAGHAGEVADPGDPETFARAVLDPSIATQEPHRSILAAHEALLRLRRSIDVLRNADAEHHVTRQDDTIVIDRRLDATRSVLVLALGFGATTVGLDDAAGLTIAFDTEDPHWGGTGAASLENDRLALVAPAAVLLVGGAVHLRGQ